jgi:hypothetical protein
MTPHLTSVLYFFWKVRAHIETYGLDKYVIPTPQHQLVYNQMNHKEVKAVQERRDFHRSAVADDNPVAGGSTRFRLSRAMSKRSRRGGEETLITREPFTVRVGVTGAYFSVAGKMHREIFCVLYITPLRNFDLLSYITENFMNRPKVQPKEREWLELDAVWKNILRKEANTNCGVEGDPCSHIHDPGSELGVYTITNLLNVPLRIAERVHSEYRGVVDLRILGCPQLSFLDDDIMRSYAEYMHEVVDQQCRWQEQHKDFSQLFARTKEEERADKAYTLPHPVGWPCMAESSGDGGAPEFTRFNGVFVLPLMMTWGFMLPMSAFTTHKENFEINIGDLPEAAKKKTLDFNTCDLESAHPTFIPDDQILTDTRRATPQLITEKYYGRNSAIGNDVKTNSRMLTWWQAVTRDLQSRREAGTVTPCKGAETIVDQIRVSMKKHTGMLMDGGYRSESLEQEFQTIQQLPKTTLGETKMCVFLDLLWERTTNHGIRHDPYMSLCSVFYKCLEDLNRDLALNATNLETFLEIFMASIHHKLGSHNDSGFMDFFHGLLIIGGRGHLSVMSSVRNGVGSVRMDNRKPNTTGAGYIQEKYNKLKEIYGIELGISKKDNKMLVFCNQQWTRVAIEQMSCMVMINGVLSSLPPPELNEKDCVILEVRGNDMDPMVKYCFSRDASSMGQMVVTTVDQSKTNERQTAQKEQVTRMPVLALCSNCLDETGEVWPTMAAVLHVVAPGCSAYEDLRSRDSTRISDLPCEQ